MTEDLFRIRDFVPEADALSAQYRAMSDAVRARHTPVEIAYGPGPRQRIDVFAPADRAAGRPVHLFIHGGYWRANVKEDSAFVAQTVLDAGAIAAIVEYELMPGMRLGAIVGQVRQAAATMAARANEFGGDAGKLSASGHSAGAHLASYLAARAPHEAGFPATPVRALLLISGVYDLQPIPSSFLQPEIGLTPEEVGQWSPEEAEQKPDVATTLVVGGLETEPFHTQAQDLCFAAERRGARIERITVPGLNHMDIVRDMGVSGTRMAGLLTETIERSR